MFLLFSSRTGCSKEHEAMESVLSELEEVKNKYLSPEIEPF